MVVIEHVADRVLDAVGGMAHRVPDPRRDRVREQRRGDPDGGDRHDQPRAPRSRSGEAGRVLKGAMDMPGNQTSVPPSALLAPAVLEQRRGHPPARLLDLLVGQPGGGLAR